MIVFLILLILLLVLIGIVCLVLFVPFRYRAKIISHGQTDADVRVTWLLHLVRLYVEYSGQEFSARLYILCFPVKLGNADESSMEQDAKDAAVKAEKTLAEDIHREEACVEAEDRHEQSRAPAGNKAKTKTKSHAKKQSVLGILKNSKEMLETGKKLVDDERNREAFRHLKKELIYLLKKIMPRRMKVKAVYSTGSPDTTGETLGILAMFPVGYRNRWNIDPDFTADHFYIDGEAQISGCIFAYQLTGAVLRILMDKNCRRLYHKIKI